MVSRSTGKAFLDESRCYHHSTSFEETCNFFATKKPLYVQKRYQFLLGMQPVGDFKGGIRRTDSEVVYLFFLQGSAFCLL